MKSSYSGLISLVLVLALVSIAVGPSTAASPRVETTRVAVGAEPMEHARLNENTAFVGQFQQFHMPACSYNSAMPGAQFQILPQPAPVTIRQQQLFDWFSPWAIGRNLILQYMRLPILVLAGERNARAGAFGIAINPQWFAELDEDVTIGIYAHELGHVSQAYGLIPMDQLAMQYGPKGQADYFAGTLLKASKQFSPAQMQKFINWVTPSAGDQTHAPGKIRADLMRAGYSNTP